MTGSTVNIADFRCRATKARVPHIFLRSPQGAPVLQLDFRAVQRAQVMWQDAALTDPGVYDIGVAREVQRLRRRAVARPISAPRRAEVLRFAGDAPLPMRVPASEGFESRPEGPSDLPPAA